MASAKVPVTFTPVDSRKVDAALARIQAKAKGVDFGGGAASIGKLSRPLGKITGQASEFQKSLEASNARVLAFGASVAVINKLSQAFGALVANTIKVEATFAKINTILGASTKELEKFGNGIFKVAQQTGTSFDQVAEGALELARQGLSVEESLNRVSTSLKLVRVAGIDSEKAVSGLTAAIKGFEGAGLTVAQIADKLAEVDTKFAVSTEDLINGLERASASARVAGVSFDELLGVVTTVQERTQRGGAVIGNAFKTIFARLSRTDTLDTLEQLGIEVLDAQGNVRSAIPLFTELAAELDKLGLQSLKAGEIIQKVAGVRQRDILISLVEDLNSGQSQFAKALQVSAGAAGALDAKNEKLNQTLEALINNLTVGGQKLASVLGEIGFTDAAADILKTFSTIVSGITDILQGDSIGAKFAQGLVKGIGSVLTGPGLALIGAIFVKLFLDLAKFGASSLKQILGINKAAMQQNALQQSVLQTLLQNEDIQREILKLEGNKVAQEQLLLKIYNQQAAALARVQKAAATVSPGLFGRGFRGGEGGVGKTGRGASGYVAAEARDVSRGVGGAPASSKVVSIPNFAFGGGKRGTMVANTSEYFVPNYAGGGDAIFNQNMVKAMGLPAGARKINAAGGYIPNFVRTRVGAGLPANNRYRTNNLSELERIDPSKLKGKARKEYDAALASKQKAKVKPLNLDASAYSYLVPQFNFSQKGGLSKTGSFKKGKKSFPFSLSNFSAFGPRIPGGVAAAGDPQDEFLEENITNSLVKESQKYANILTKAVGGRVVSGGNLRTKFSSGGTKGAFGALRSSVGSAFEIATSEALGIDDAAVKKGGGDFDIRNPSQEAKKKLEALFGSAGGRSKGEFKVSTSIDNIASFAKKIATEKKMASGGYIPNFAMSPLDDAIEREKAAGLPINQIRINQSGKLRNAQNPMGLAVTNTRDEPTGAIPNFTAFSSLKEARASNMSDKQIAAGFGGKAAKDEINNLGKSAGATSSALDASIGKIFALQLGVSAITNSFAEQGGKMQEFGNSLSGAINTMLVLSTVGASPLGAFGKGGGGLKGLVGLAKSTKGLTRVFGLLKGLAGPVALGFTAVDIALKSFTGKGVLGYAKDGLVALGLAASESSKKFASSAEEFAQRTSGLGVGGSVNVAIEQLRKEAKARSLGVKAEELSESVLAFSGVSGLRAGQQLKGPEQTVITSANYAGVSTSTFRPTGTLTKEQLKPVQEALGNLFAGSAEEIQKVIPGISDENAQAYIESQAEIVKDLDAKIKAAVIAGVNVEDNINTAAQSTRIAIIDMFLRAQKAAKAEAVEVEDDIERVSGRDAATAIALAASRRQNQIDISAAQTAARREQLQRTPMGSVERAGSAFASESDNLETSAKSERLKIRTSLIEQAKLQESLKDIEKEKLDTILAQVSEYGSIEEIQKAIGSIQGVSVDNLEELVQLAELQNTQLEEALTKDKQILEIRKQQAIETAKANKGLAKYSKDAQQDLIDQAENLPNILATNLEQSLSQTFNNLANGAHDTVGDALLSIALSFGQELQNQMNQRLAKQTTSALFGEGTKGGGLLEGLSDMITGGGDKDGQGNKGGKGAKGGGLLQGISGMFTGGGNKGGGGFFKDIGSFFGFNSGGIVPGGSGVRDDVPAVLTGGEYVIKKSAVQKYGKGFLDQLNSSSVNGMQEGGFFVPGTRGQGQIKGKDNLLKFALQQSTSGATDFIRSGGSAASIDLEVQSSRLTTFGRFRDSPARRSLREAQEKAYNLYLARLEEEERVKQAKKARSNMLKSGITGAFTNLGIGALTGGLGSLFNKPGGNFSSPGFEAAANQYSSNALGYNVGSNQSNTFVNLGGGQTYDASMTGSGNGFGDYRAFAGGGSVSSGSNALLMGGEYVLSSAAASRIGRENLDDINMMRYSNGGPAGNVASDSSNSSSGVGEVNITINMEKGDASVDENSNGGADPTQTKEFARRIKDVVVGVINEEKRVSGSLFTRRK
jgi:TP901 family phage tail tape measure protein